MDSGIHASLHPTCHHQIVYAKSNLKIHSHFIKIIKGPGTSIQCPVLSQKQVGMFVMRYTTI